ncbi:MAG: hypothetical protein RLZZ339_2095 [Cyanobacteriota bacterium]|jgi:5-formyltetrahydrofolate cyclo-ligase|uniref:Uncharacterized protein n=1 Tax=Microcystis aeruginosa NIES-44 TaxID=449439 RepID=A0A0A1W0X4_MICAE|nr:MULTISPECIES: hypothetical protein [Microcystis]MCZ8038444.1 hypothetical protein [Microcystis sp. LE17-20A]MCZ8211993.1 hypothetical protein [Microcystis sp. LE19-8.1F]GAL95732.1 hypothetical protein N44_04588 [Microcystis aeruginosa NIES-44]
MTTVTSNDIQELKDLLSAMREETRKQMISLREETREQIDALKEDNRQQLESLREENNQQFINLQKEITQIKIITAKIEGTIQSQAVLTPKKSRFNRESWGIKKLETNSYCRYHCFYQCHNYLVYSRRKFKTLKSGIFLNS